MEDLALQKVDGPFDTYKYTPESEVVFVTEPTRSVNDVLDRFFDTDL